MSWRIETNSMGRVVVIVNEQGWPIARMVDDTDKESARLIAAAPDMLAEGKALIDRLKGMAIHPSHYAGLEAAIAKATAPEVEHLPADDTEGGAL